MSVFQLLSGTTQYNKELMKLEDQIGIVYTTLTLKIGVKNPEWRRIVNIYDYNSGFC